MNNHRRLMRDKAFNIAKNPKYDRYQHGLASVFFGAVKICTKPKISKIITQANYKKN